MQLPLNLAIMKSWENWITVLFMLIIAVIAADLAVSFFSTKDKANG